METYWKRDNLIPFQSQTTSGSDQVVVPPNLVRKREDKDDQAPARNKNSLKNTHQIKREAA